jgi:hypothetical protein
MDGSRPDRSIAELLSDLSQQTTELVRHELRLAQVELGAKLAVMGRGTALIGAGAALALTALITVAGTVVLFLIERGITPSVSALLTALLFGIAAGALLQFGLSTVKQQSLTPAQTIDSIKETTQWLKRETR